MAIIYDIYGNPFRALPAMGGDSLIDTRTAATLAAANAETAIDIAQEHTASIDVRGTLSLTLIFEVAFDSSNYQQYPIWNPTTESYVASITTAGQFQADIPAGAKKARVRCSAYTSGSATVVFRASNAIDFLYAKDTPANLAQTATGAAAAAVTATLAAPGAGLYNYIVGLYITKFAAALLTAAATPVLVTTTGLNNTPTISFSAGADAQGTVEKQQFEPVKPWKASAANTAVTIVAPATTGVIWRINVLYYIGA
jgi:hypothetical protein